MRKTYNFRRYNSLIGIIYDYKGKPTHAEGELEKGKIEKYEVRGVEITVYMQAKGCEGHLEVEIASEKKKKIEKFVKILENRIR